MFRCRDCGETFELYEAGCYEPQYDYPYDYEYENYLVCPYCESLDVEEVYDDYDDD